MKRQQFLVCFTNEQSQDPFYLTLTVGLKMDQEIKTEQIELYKYGNVYFPNNDYYNSDSMPIEWLELFEDPKKLRDKELDDKELEKFEEQLRKELADNDENYRKSLPTHSRRNSITKISVMNTDKKRRYSVSQDSLFQSVRL